MDQLHTGTVIGKLVSPRSEVTASNDTLREGHVQARDGVLLEQDWGQVAPVFPVPSGGLHPGIVPDVLDIVGADCCIQLGGGIHGHPDGSQAGARALRDVIDGWLDDRRVEDVAQESKPVRQALDKWGTEHPK